MCCSLGLLWIYVLTRDLEWGLTSLMSSDVPSPKKEVSSGTDVWCWLLVKPSQAHSRGLGDERQATSGSGIVKGTVTGGGATKGVTSK